MNVLYFLIGTLAAFKTVLFKKYIFCTHVVLRMMLGENGYKNWNKRSRLKFLKSLKKDLIEKEMMTAQISEKIDHA